MGDDVEWWNDQGGLDDQKSTIPRRLGESNIATEYLSKISNMRSNVRKNRDANEEQSCI